MISFTNCTNYIHFSPYTSITHSIFFLSLSSFLPPFLLLSLSLSLLFFVLVLSIKKLQNQVSCNLQRKSNIRNKKLIKKIRYLFNSTNKECKYHANVTIKDVLRIARTPYTWSFPVTLIVLLDCCLDTYSHVGKTGFFFFFHFARNTYTLRPMEYSLFYFVPIVTGRNETDPIRRLLVHTCNSS